MNSSRLTKLIVTAIALRFVAAGKLGLDTDVNSYLKSWKVPDNEFTTDKPGRAIPALAKPT